MLSTENNTMSIVSLINRESYVGSFIDGFSLIFVIAIIVLVLICFLKPSPENHIVPFSR